MPAVIVHADVPNLLAESTFMPSGKLANYPLIEGEVSGDTKSIRA